MSISIGKNSVTYSPNITANRVTTFKKQVKKLKNPYKIGDVVKVKNIESKVPYKGTVIQIKDLIKDDVLYDQKLYIQNKIYGTKLYMASVLRKLEEKLTK